MVGGQRGENCDRRFILVTGSIYVCLWRRVFLAMMPEIFPVLITARSASTRLPGKLLLPFGAQGNVLVHVIRRVRYFGFEPIVCCPLSDRICKVAVAENCKFFEGDEAPQVRWLQAMRHYNIKIAHALDADDTFFDAGEVARSISFLIKNKLRQVRPTDSSDKYALGMMGHSLSLEDEWLPSGTLTESKPNLLIRMTLDYEEDYWFLRSVLRLYGHNATRREIDTTIRNHTICDVNIFNNDQWRARRATESAA